MKHAYSLIPALLLCIAAQTQAQDSFQLEDAAVGNDVEWSSIGKINWKSLTGGPWFGNPGNFFGTTTANIPTMSPYGDVLAYSAGGLGDVDGDGIGDYAVTWYEADKDRGDPCGNHPKPWLTNPANTSIPPTIVNKPSTMERIGLVRVMSGDPAGGTSSTCKDIDAATGNIDTKNVDGVTQTDYIRRIGAPIAALGDPDIHADFWGTGNNALWSHEITTVGDIDGDGRNEMMLSSNIGQSGVVEIWAFTDQYQHDSLVTTERWVRLITITGVNDASITEEFGYQSHEGPPPLQNGFQPVSFARDFNNDDQPDLLIASKFYRDPTISSSRDEAIGAAWIFMLPKASVFSNIDRMGNGLCDVDDNRSGGSGSDGITDLLPLKLTTDDYNVRITGHQQRHASHPTGDPTIDTHYPRHFGYDISPAGDIDDDGYLDLAVSAPYHYDPDTYDTYYNTNSGTVAPADRHTGNLYFFLSDSDVRSDATTFYELQPKHHVPGAYQFSNCNGSSYITNVWTRNMSAQQISFDSSEADYVMEGTEPSNSFGFAPFAGHLVAGVSLNKGATTDLDPDLVVGEGRRNRFYVFNDIQAVISAAAKPTSTKLLWDADTSNWLANGRSALFTNTDVFLVNSGSDSTSFGVNIKGIRSLSIPGSFPTLYDFDGNGSQDQSLYAGISGFGLAGDLTGDGDCEIIVSADAVWWHQSGGTPIVGAQRQASVALDITADASLINLHAEFLPEPYAFEDPDLAHPRYQKQSNSFNAGSSMVRNFGISTWPLWNPSGIEDTILGIRYFPRRVTKFPNANATAWLNIPTPGVGNPAGLTEEEYDKMTLVPAGKTYLVRSTPVAP
ncbi:MAG: integrin alpha [Phycisphaerales bacterium]